ncbi:MAG: rod shape-determining protein MreD [Rhodospirillales bacterium]|nr:rod shape-determining protein MreD [Rhodospirillales bacterium]
MKPVFWSRLDTTARRLTPFGLTVLLVLINVLPLQMPGFARVMPLLPLMSIYLWAVHHPNLMPAYAVFLIGLLQDTLTGTPLGVNVMAYLIVYGTVVWQRRFLVGKSFAVIWVGFSLVGAGAMVITWLLISSYHSVLASPDAMAFQYLLSLGVFPLLSWLFMRWQQAFLSHL